MKIAIVTLPLGLNYGGIMQNYALQQTLKRLGHTPETLNYIDPRRRRITDYPRFVASAMRTLVMRCKGQYRRFVKLKNVSIPKAQTRFMNTYLSLTKPMTDYTPFGQDYDAYITGSDQVWRPAYTTHLLDMYLRFVTAPRSLRISYAASFGVDTWEYSPKQTHDAAELIKKFDAISVREFSGTELCRDHFDVSATVVLDPTMLLTKEDYLPLCAPKHNEAIFLGSYVIDGHPHRFRTIFETCSSLNIRHKDIDPNARPITEWLAMFRDASYIITDSFHGTVFSILFNKPFVVLVNKDRGASRFYSILSKLGLENRIASENHSPAEILSLQIDWTDVNSRLDSLRTKSLEFLIKALSHA